MSVVTDPAEPTPAEGRITLLLTSPRTSPGLLSWPAWERLRAAGGALAAGIDPVWEQALAEAGVPVTDLGASSVGERARELLDRAAPEPGAAASAAGAAGGSDVVWFGSPDGDPGLTDSLAEQLSRRAVAAHPPQVEVLTGAPDVPGARVLDLVEVMDRLRSPGGCPWDAEQTHVSLLRYLLEETHEVIEAVETGDRSHLVEELGDLLLQVVFHARIGEEAAEPFDLDEVAAGIVAKLVRRHPHVFADADAPADPAERDHAWERLKAQEKQRSGVFDGIPPTLPALARAQKMLDRLARARGVPAPELVVALAADRAAATGRAAGTARATEVGPDAPGNDVGLRLLGVVAEATVAGRDAETELRAQLTSMIDVLSGPGSGTMEQ